MKYIIFILIIIGVVIYIFSAENNKNSNYIYNTKTKEYISYKQFINDLKNYDITFFGELHNNTFCHNMELKIFKSLNNDSIKTALGLEMFERDVQQFLNDYLQSKISIKDFIDHSRPWGNYNSDYKPLVEFAKSMNLPVIAANIPRRIASTVSQFGEEKINKNDSLFYNTPYKDCPEYKEKFMQTMKGITQSGTPMAKMHNPDNIFLAQLYKDATMAFSINEFMQKNKNYRLFFVCGEFHSNYHLGTIEQLNHINNNYKIVNISYTDSIQNIDKNKSDYIIIEELYK